MIKRSLLVILLFFALVPVAWGATYYVDTAADPGGDGTNQYLTGAHCAFKTIAQVKAASFSPGDSILFKRGCTWREMLSPSWNGSAGNVITFGAYGSGAKPIISGADVVTSWTDNSGNVWRTTVAATPNQVMFNGVLGTKVASIAECNSDKKWYAIGTTLYTYGLVNPNTTYPSKIEASVRDFCVSTWAYTHHVTLDNLCTEKANSTWAGAVIFGTGAQHYIVQNSESRWNNAHGYSIYSAAWDNIRILNNSSHDNGVYGIAGYQHAGATAGNEVIISGNEVYNNRSHGVGEGIYVYANYYIVEHNWVHDNGDANGDCIGIHIYTPNGDTAYGQNNIIRYNLVSGQKANHMDGSGIECDYSTGLAGVNQIYYNIVFGCDGPGIDIYGGSANIYNNVCYNNHQDSKSNTPVAEISIANPGNRPGTVTNVKNNIAYATQAGVAFYVDAYTVANGTLAVTNNCFYGTGQSNWYSYNGTAGNNLTTFNGFTGFDNNLNADPLFVSTTTPDFHLQAGSPCINAGVDVGLTVDYDGKEVPL